MIRRAQSSQAQCMRLPRRERRRIARRRTEKERAEAIFLCERRRRRRIPSAMRERRNKRARVGCHFLVQLWRMVQDRDHTRFTRVTV